MISMILLAPLLLQAGPVVSVELRRGEAATIDVPGGPARTLKLIALEERTEPYFESATGSIAQAVVEARLILELDGRRFELTGGPFRLPSAFGGLSFLLACTRNWAGGIAADPLRADARVEVAVSAGAWSAGSPLFPVRNYRWRGMNYQHTFLALAVNQARVYYHRGEDFGMIPDLEEVLSATGGDVAVVPGPKGDGQSNGFVVRGADGLHYRYAHMNAANIDPALQPGVSVKRGQRLGLTGNTWQGKPVSDPHLHLDVATPGEHRQYRNTFPMIAAAYQAAYPDELLPIAGGWRHVYANSDLRLDGSLSLPARQGGRIVSYRWTFHDGSTAQGPVVTRRYASAGAYSERLTVRDDQGREASDFVEVFVLSLEQRKPPPYAWINYFPIRGVRAGDEVRFQTRFSNLRDVTIEFGDGQSAPYSLESRHRYAKPGEYVVTVRGADSGSGEGVFHVCVIVE